MDSRDTCIYFLETDCVYSINEGISEMYNYSPHRSAFNAINNFRIRGNKEKINMTAFHIDTIYELRSIYTVPDIPITMCSRRHGYKESRPIITEHKDILGS